MAETQTKSKAAPPAKADAAEEPTFPRQRIVAEANDLLGEPRGFIVAGALADLRGDGDITLSQARAAIDKFLGRELREAEVDDTQEGDE